MTGWLRTVEVTRGADGSAHPHYHALLLVPGDYFHTTDKYVTQVGWTKLWRESLKLDYDPIVHVAAVKPKRGRPAKGETLPAIGNAAREALKYAVKPSDMTADGGLASGTHPAVGQAPVHRLRWNSKRHPGGEGQGNQRRPPVARERRR